MLTVGISPHEISRADREQSTGADAGGHRASGIIGRVSGGGSATGRCERPRAHAAPSPHKTTQKEELEGVGGCVVNGFVGCFEPRFLLLPPPFPNESGVDAPPPRVDCDPSSRT